MLFFFIHPHPQNMTLSFVIIVIFLPEDDNYTCLRVNIFRNLKTFTTKSPSL